MEARSNKVWNPKSASEVTHGWLEYMLTCYERRRDPEEVVRVINYEVKAACEPGENLGSELIKIWVEATLTGRKRNDDDDEEEEEEKKEQIISTIKKDEEEKKEEEEKRGESNFSTTTFTSTSTRKEYNLIAKFNNGTELKREFIKYGYFDLNELLIYSHVVEQLNTWQAKVLRERQGKGQEQGPGPDGYKVFVPEFVYGVCTDEEFVLVMQDVSVIGYTIQDKMQGLDLPHVLLAADRLARLHAVSYAFHQAHDFLRQYPSFEKDIKILHFMIDYTFTIYDGAVEMVKRRPELGPLLEKLVENRDFLVARMKEMIRRDDPKSRVMCVSHGDYWINNLLYRHGRSTDGSPPPPEEVMMIDWGLLDWRNPMFDLQQLVYNCTTLSLRRRHLQEILTHYHSTFTAATTALGAPVQDYGSEEFMKEWKRTLVFGVIHYGIFANTIVLSRKANESYQKGSASSGLKGAALRTLGKIMAYLLVQGWLKSLALKNNKKNFQPVLEELASGENQVQTARVLDIMMEAYESGVLDL